jgi:hypothetical protein
MQKQKSRVILIAAGVMVAGSLLLSPLAEPISDSFANRTKPKTNSEHVLKVAQSDRQLAPLLLDKAKLASYLSAELKNLEHVNPKEYYSDVDTLSTPKSDELMRFGLEDLVRVYYLLTALQQPAFRQQIGKELELDTKDRSCEHGGTIHLKSSKRFAVEMIPNDPDPPGEIINEMPGSFRNPDDSYLPKTSQDSPDRLIHFHFHAKYENSSYSSVLSSDDFICGGGAMFSRLGEGQFNADMALYRKNGEKYDRVNLDLGVYSY